MSYPGGKMSAETLVNTQAEFPPPSEGTRDRRYRLRAAAAKVGYGRVRRCGRKRVSLTVQIRNHDGVCSASGFETCGSIWSCPVCAAKISEVRRQEVRKAMLGCSEAGGAVYMMAFTAPHYRGQGLRGLKDRMGLAWRKMLSGAPWGRLRDDMGLIGYIKGLEVTHGLKNGWHPHFHILFFLEKPLTEQEREKFEWKLFNRWDQIVCKAGSEPCNFAVFRLEQAHTPEAAGDYVAKFGSDYEITHLHTKAAKGGGRSPWALLDLSAKGYDEAGKRFGEYSRAMFGARQLTWSKGLKDLYSVSDPSDEEAANADHGEVVITLDGKEVDEVQRAGYRCFLAMLRAAETGGAVAVRAFLRDFGLGRRSDDLRAFRSQYYGETDNDDCSEFNCGAAPSKREVAIPGVQ